MTNQITTLLTRHDVDSNSPSTYDGAMADLIMASDRRVEKSSGSAIIAVITRDIEMLDSMIVDGISLAREHPMLFARYKGYLVLVKEQV